MLLNDLSGTSYFKIDALGLVTILGQRELDLRIGTLRSTSWLEALPLFAPYLTAGGYITDPIPGFHLYNITDGILATDLSAWFTRWLLIQNVTWNSSNIYITPKYTSLYSKQDLVRVANSLMISIALMGAIVAIAILSQDAWAIANAIAMLFAGLLRWSILHQLRMSMSRYAQYPAHMNAAIKALCTLPNGKAVTIHTTRAVVIDCLLTNAAPESMVLYRLTQTVAWLCFGIHIICLGMSSLVNQIIAVVALALCTMLVIGNVAADNSNVGRYHITLQHSQSTCDSRTETYLRLQLNAEEEEGLVAWSLAPQRRNVAWWQKYQELKSESHCKLQPQYLP